MCSATPFLPRSITLLMKRATTSLLYRASGAGTRRTTFARLGMLFSASVSCCRSRGDTVKHTKKRSTPWETSGRFLPCSFDYQDRGCGQPTRDTVRPITDLCDRPPASLLGGLGTVLGPRLLPVFHAAGIEGAPHDVVADAREILHPAAAHQHDGVLLQVVPLARDVRRDLHVVGQAHAGDLAQSRIGLLRRHRLDLGADAPLLRRAFAATHLAGVPAERVVGEAERRRLRLLRDALAALPYQLINRRHDQLLGGQRAGSDRALPRASLPGQLRRHLSATAPHRDLWSGETLSDVAAGWRPQEVILRGARPGVNP